MNSSNNYIDTYTYQTMRRTTPSAGSISSSSSSSTATQYRESEPPESLTDDHHSFDCSSFDFAAMTTTMLSPSPSLTSSFNSLSSQESKSSPQSPCSPPNRPLGSIKGWGSTLSRSRCVNNLSSFGGGSDSADVGVCSRRTIPAYNNKSGANDGWGYFVDTR